MAPELFLTNTTTDFTKSPGIDVFALGATLYYMIVGRPPWMAKNQIDLAAKIKNIELTFPVENVDPHLKYLLKNMLAKDYRTRWNLDSVVVDDWVTFEGSEPLFEKDDFLVNDFIDFESITRIEDPAMVPLPIKILIVHESLPIRVMLHQQINCNLPAICVCAHSALNAIEIMKSTVSTHPNNNFDFIFIELAIPDKETGIKTIKEIRSLGYHGEIVAMSFGDMELDNSIVSDSTASAIVKRPIANRDLTLLLTKQDTTLSDTRVSAEEFDNAITLNRTITAVSGVKAYASLKRSSMVHPVECVVLIGEFAVFEDGKRSFDGFLADVLQ